MCDKKPERRFPWLPTGGYRGGDGPLGPPPRTPSASSVGAAARKKLEEEKRRKKAS